MMPRGARSITQELNSPERIRDWYGSRNRWRSQRRRSFMSAARLLPALFEVGAHPRDLLISVDIAEANPYWREPYPPPH